MKEIISFVMPKELCKDCIVTKCRKMLKDKTQCYLNRKPYALVENKVPETFEELKELCKDITLDLKICKDGTIYCYEYLLAKNRTPQQMWEIIMGLLGE